MILPETATAAVLFIGDQILHVSRNENGEIHKFISSESLREAVSRLPIDSGWTSQNVRRWGVSRGVPWFVSFHEPKVRRAFAGRKRIRVPCPPIVFAGKGRTYFIFAAKEVFSPGMMLYRLPFPNVYNDGKICFGANRMVEAKAKNEPKMWRLFWDAPFTTHMMSTDGLVRMSNKGMKKYPLGRLKDRLATVEQLVEELKGESNAPDGFA
jgi:hypothetical protein